MQNLPAPKKRGRPKGSKNAKTRLREQVKTEIRAKVGELLLTHAEEVVRLIIQQALGGCLPSQKMVLDRFMPAHKAVDGDASDEAKPVVTINVISSEGPVPTGVTIEGSTTSQEETT